MRVALAGVPEVGGIGRTVADLGACDWIEIRYDQGEYAPRNLEGLDWLIVVGSPWTVGRRYDLVHEAHIRRVNVCLVADPTRLQPVLARGNWLNEVDLVWSPTEYGKRLLAECAGEARQRGLPCPWESRICGGRWGVDLERFAYRERQTCQRLLFVNGSGGAVGRKGARTLADAARLVPDVPVLCISRTGNLPGMPHNVAVEVREYDSPHEMYDRGDVLLALEQFSGFAHQILEAQACGLPVVVGDAPPMNELGPVRRTRASSGFVYLAGQRLDRASIDPAALAGCMRDLHGKQIAAGSRNARRWVEQNRSLACVLDELRQTLESFQAELRDRQSGSKAA